MNEIIENFGWPAVLDPCARAHFLVGHEPSDHVDPSHAPACKKEDRFIYHGRKLICPLLLSPFYLG